MSIDILIGLIFCYTVIRVWVMLSSKRYGFLVRKNVPSMLIKLTFNALNLTVTLLVMVKFTNFLDNFLND
jgi:hypothetical protein